MRKNIWALFVIVLALGFISSACNKSGSDTPISPSPPSDGGHIFGGAGGPLSVPIQVAVPEGCGSFSIVYMNPLPDGYSSTFKFVGFAYRAEKDQFKPECSERFTLQVGTINSPDDMPGDFGRCPVCAGSNLRLTEGRNLGSVNAMVRESIKVPYLRVSMGPPRGFTADKIAGFQNIPVNWTISGDIVRLMNWFQAPWLV